MSHSRRSAALRDSLPSSLPTSSPGNGGVEDIALRVASAAATPVKGIPTPPTGESSGGGRYVSLPFPGPVGIIYIHKNNDTKYFGLRAKISPKERGTITHQVRVHIVETILLLLQW